MEITHNKTNHVFEFSEGGNSAVVEYKTFDGGINIMHTFVVIITCPFARVYVARHKEYENLL